jgi:ribose 5-phosphate isomerase A
VVDESKIVKKLGRFPLPVEIIKMARPLVEPRLAELGLNPKLRMKKDGTAAGTAPVLTDENNWILDCHCGVIENPEETAAEIRSIVGVVEHGLFLAMAEMALVAGEGGVRELTA